MTPFGKSGSTLLKLMRDAAGLAVARSDNQTIDAIYVAAMNPEEFTGESNLASRVVEALELTGIPALRVETATSAGAAAFQTAFQGVASGLYRNILVIGGEKMTHLSTSATTRILAKVLDEQERLCGATMPALAAMITESYRRKYHLSEARLEQILCRIAMKNHLNGSRNPYAQFREPISRSKYLSSKLIATPLRLYDCAPISDGAAAVVVSAEPTDLIISGIGQGTAPVSLRARPDFTSFPATQIAAAKAYDMAALSPREIDFAEIHDAFTPFELISIEDLGFFAPGKGGDAVEAGATSVDGERPINPSGGLKSRGHPVGASGVAQIVEAAKILRGEARFKLKREPRRALMHSIGGLATNNFVTIVERARDTARTRKPLQKTGAESLSALSRRKHAAADTRVAAEGEIETFTVLHVTPDGFLPPLGLALIRDKKGSRLMAQAEDIKQLKVGRLVYLRQVAGIYSFTVGSHLREVQRALRKLLRAARGRKNPARDARRK